MDHQGYQLYSHLTREGCSRRGSITGSGIVSRMGSAPYHSANSLSRNRTDGGKTSSGSGPEAVRVRPSHFHRLHFATTRNHLKTMKSMPLLILCLGSATFFASPAFSDEAWQVTRKAWDALGKKNFDEVERLANESVRRWGERGRKINNVLVGCLRPKKRQYPTLNELATIAG